MSRVSFDRLARVYGWLEWIAFGRDLERARFAHLASLTDARRILVIGDGDGRCLARILELAPAATVDAIDTSSRMLERAASRLDSEARRRVTFRQADVTTFAPADRYDAVTTMFVIDCLTEDEARDVIERIGSSVVTGGTWLWADFVEPPSGWRRVRARLWLGLLYRFFGLATGLAVRRVPPAEALFEAAGFTAASTLELQHGLIRSVRYTVRPDRAAPRVS